MALALGKIVKSNAHTDYVCQVYGRKEVPDSELPQGENYAFGTFVKIELESPGDYLVGLVYDTVLLNPEFGRLGPRLSPQAELAIFTPDYLNERAVLLGIVAVGSMSLDEVTQRVPRLAANSDALVYQMDDGDIQHFHNGDGRLNLTYLPTLIQQQADNPLVYHLARVVLDELKALLPEHRPMLDVLADDLLWRTQINPMGGL